MNWPSDHSDLLMLTDHWSTQQITDLFILTDRLWPDHSDLILTDHWSTQQITDLLILTNRSWTGHQITQISLYWQIIDLHSRSLSSLYWQIVITQTSLYWQIIDLCCRSLTSLFWKSGCDLPVRPLRPYTDRSLIYTADHWPLYTYRQVMTCLSDHSDLHVLMSFAFFFFVSGGERCGRVLHDSGERSTAGGLPAGENAG